MNPHKTCIERCHKKCNPSNFYHLDTVNRSLGFKFTHALIQLINSMNSSFRPQCHENRPSPSITSQFAPDIMSNNF